jgi:hypothetical protein
MATGIIYEYDGYLIDIVATRNNHLMKWNAQPGADIAITCIYANEVLK